MAVVQLIRIQMRVPEYGWTTQKVFHLLNFLVASLRLGVFACWKKVGHSKPHVILRSCAITSRQCWCDARGHQVKAGWQQTLLIARHLIFGDLSPRDPVCAGAAGGPAGGAGGADGPAGAAVLLHLHAAGAVLGGDIPPGPQPAHLQAAPHLRHRQRRRVPHPGAGLMARCTNAGCQAALSPASLCDDPARRLLVWWLGTQKTTACNPSRTPMCSSTLR